MSRPERQIEKCTSRHWLKAQGVTQKVRCTLGRAWAFRLIAAEGFRSIEHVRKGFNCFFFWVLTSFQLEVNLHMVAELLREL